MYYLKHYGLCDGNYLAHHGIVGMKWGKRNGPPYPLSDAKHDKVVNRASKGSKKVFREEASGKKKKSVKDKWNSLSDKQKALIIAGGVAVGLGLTATALYPYRKEIISGMKNVNFLQGDPILQSLTNSAGNIKNTNIINKRDGIVDKATGFIKKSGDSTMKEDMKSVNKAFNLFSNAYANNCSYCSIAYEMRRRGYDVIAKPAEKGNGAEFKQLMQCYKNAKPKMIKTYLSNSVLVKSDDGLLDIKTTNNPFAQTLYDSISEREGILNTVSRTDFSNVISNSFKEEAAKAPNSRGELTVFFKYGGGHSMAYEIENGVFNVLDTQRNKSYDYNLFNKKMIKHIDSMVITRLDDLEVDVNEIKKYVQ